MFHKHLLYTNENLINISLLLLRCLIGILLFAAGSSKVLGWFGGFGFEVTKESFAKIGFSVFLTYLSSYTEFIGGLFLAIGFLTRPTSFLVMINMFVATLVLLPSGFLGSRGASYPFIFLIIDIVILIVGPKAFSIDYLIFKRSSISRN